MTAIELKNVFKPEGRLAGIPAWWRTFVFQVLNGRQLSVYLYLLTLMEDGAHCSPTTRQIADDLGLMGATMVFDAMNVLEESGFIRRSRTRGVPTAGARRNRYQRPSCEYTIFHLLQNDRINVSALPEEGMREMLGARYQRYAAATGADRSAVLKTILQEALSENHAPGLDAEASA